MTDPILACRDVTKSYRDGSAELVVLKKLQLAINVGETLAIIGASGSGKSTLLHLLGGLDSCSTGTVQIEGKDWQALTEAQRCTLRNQKLGFIYQFHHLLPEFTALENVMMPLLIRKKDPKQVEPKAVAMLQAVGLGQRLQHKPGQLSGGERQRVAIARALVSEPACILADEPTGNLDDETANEIFDLLLTLNKKVGTSLVVVTHDLRLAAQLDKQLKLTAGHLEIL